MKFARKLYEIAFGKRPATMEPYLKKIKRKAEAKANESLFCMKIELEAKARFFKEDIANALYEDGFTVTTEYYKRIGVLEMTIDWEKETPRKPYHKEY